MSDRGRAVGRRLAVALAAAVALAVLLAGSELRPWQDAEGSSGAALAAGALSPVVVNAERRDASPRLATLAAQSRPPVRPPGAAGAPTWQLPLGRRSAPRSGSTPARSARQDPVRQQGLGSAALPGALLSFDGAKNTDNVAGNNNGCGRGALVAPSDSEGDTGPNHYVEWVNCVIQIFDKSGSSLLGPIDGSALFAGFGGACETQNRGDPIVLYDRMADRWLMSQIALPTGGPSHECLAVSQTPDPTGGYFRYDFVWPNNKVNDYPKLGVWPDGWYISANQFDQSLNFYQGVGVAAFNRTAMLGGSAGTAVYFDLAGVAPGSFSLLPSHLNGHTLPPAGSPNYFVEVESPVFDPSFTTDRLQVWKFHVDFAAPGSSTLTGPIVLDTAPFDPILCGFNPFDQPCVPQPNTTNPLDALPDRLLFRNNYRNFGTHEALVVNHTVNAGGGVAGVRWYELRIASGTPSIFQQGTFSPDSTYRWMGSINLDASGNIAVGYSASSGSVFPSIRYAARRPTDPPGTLNQGEALLFAGTGSQTSPNRWGDYTTLSIDPVDDCTFWYVNQYYAVTSGFNWRTRITTFRMPTCVPPPPPPGSGGPPAAQPNNDDEDEPGARTPARTPQERQARQRTDASGLDDTHISGNVMETHLDEQPPFIVVANSDGNVKVVLYEDAATFPIQVGQYFAGTGEKQHEQLFWAYDGAVE